jgi:acyl-CoA hydrolase
VDELSFKAPVKMGDHVLIKAMVNYVGQTSLEVGVKVQSEDPTTGETQITTSAYLTFVCLDENRKPAKVPGILVKSKDEIRRFKNAQKRVQSRKRLAKMIHKK